MLCRRPLPRIAQAPAVFVLFGTLWLSGCASSSISSPDTPEAGSAYTRLGLAYLEQNNLKRALNALDRAEELDPGNPETLQALALVYQRQGEDDLAAEQFKKALAANADFTRARNNYAAFLYQQGNYQRACQQLETAAWDPQYEHRARLFTNLGQCYTAVNQTSRARESLKRAGKIDPRHARSYWLLANWSSVRAITPGPGRRCSGFCGLAGPPAKRWKWPQSWPSSAATANSPASIGASLQARAIRPDHRFEDAQP